MLDKALWLAGCGFHVFPLRPNSRKPVVSQLKATLDEKTIRKWWRNGPDRNVGISTTLVGDSGDPLLVVDEDNKNGKKGADTVLAHEMEDRLFPVTFTVATPSGGRHYYYLASHPARLGVDALGPGLDVRGHHGYVVGPGSVIDGKEYRIVTNTDLAAAPAWMERMAGRPGEKKSAKKDKAAPPVNLERVMKRGRQIVAKAAPGQAGSRNQQAFKLAARLKDEGCLPAQARELIDEWECEPPLDAAELEHVVESAFRYGQDPPGSKAPDAAFDAVDEEGEPDTWTLEKLNEKYAVVTVEGRFLILYESVGVKGDLRHSFMDVQSFHHKFEPCKRQVGKRSEVISRLWMEWSKRMEYESLVVVPSPGERQKAIIGPDGKKHYNTWKGFAIKPAPTAGHPAVRMYLQHARENICQGDEKQYRWVLSWLAHIVQRPQEKLEAALVLKGEKGTGKNQFIKVFEHILGASYCLAVNERYVTSSFNSHLEGNLLFVLDEMSWRGSKHVQGILNDLITGPTRSIEHKGQKPYTISSYSRIAILTNEANGVPATLDERRYTVLTVGEGWQGNRVKFGALNAALKDGGYEALFRFLLEYPIDDAVYAPLFTPGLQEQIESNMSAAAVWWSECLQAGEILGLEFPVSEAWGKAGIEVPCQKLEAAAHRHWKAKDMRRKSMAVGSAFGREMRKLMGNAWDKKRAGGQPARYIIPTLEEARAAWTKNTGLPLDEEDTI